MLGSQLTVNSKEIRVSVKEREREGGREREREGGREKPMCLNLQSP